MKRALFAVSILIYFFYFAGEGLNAGFSQDDLMNMYQSWRHPISRHLLDIVLFFQVSPTFRPLGSLFYRVLFEVFGFHPLPFRIACYGLLLLNLLLAYKLTRRLTGSCEAAAWTVLLYAFHPQFFSLYSSTGYCYDLLCATFYFSALLYYLNMREAGWKQIAAWSGLYILCLNSKEMAVTLPVMIAVYELLTTPRIRRGLIPLTGGVLTALFIFGRVLRAQGLTANDAYRPVLQVGVYLSHGHRFLSEAVYQSENLGPAAACLILAFCFAMAFRFRLLPLRFGLAWMLIGILPVAFIEQRGFDAVTIPALGLALFVATLIARARQILAWRVRPTFGLAAGFLLIAAAHSTYGQLPFREANEHSRLILNVHKELLRFRCAHPTGHRLLFVRDPFPDFEWATTFLVYLTYRDAGVYVKRLDWLVSQHLREQARDFDHHLSWKDGRLEGSGR
ncbi:MAG: glycosyltransferase family 39 protein [Bryobacteraceae bacterium]